MATVRWRHTKCQVALYLIWKATHSENWPAVAALFSEKPEQNGVPWTFCSVLQVSCKAGIADLHKRRRNICHCWKNLSNLKLLRIFKERPCNLSQTLPGASAPPGGQKPTWHCQMLPNALAQATCRRGCCTWHNYCNKLHSSVNWESDEQRQ